MADDRAIAYFSMEIALDAAMPTYSGGLGVLAGDTIRAAADLKVPMVAVSLLHRKGYFFQHLDPSGWQTEEPDHWVVNDFAEEMKPQVTVAIEGRTVHLRAWKYDVVGFTGFAVPVYLLDADLPENSAYDRALTDSLYGGDNRYRLCQEVILGIGGVRMLRALGYNALRRFHLNEGHAALLTVELLEEESRRSGKPFAHQEDVDVVRKKCVFTTHTPVKAGHDQFPLALATQVLGQHPLFTTGELFASEGVLNMTSVALNLSHFVNGVAKRHGQVSQKMFSSYVIEWITNGVHAPTWASGPFRDLFDRYIPGWQNDNFSLRYALGIPGTAIWQAHTLAKRDLIDRLNRETNAGLDARVLTLGFARRAATYKRADLLFQDIDRLKRISAQVGPLQVIYAGKAHPADQAGKELIQRIHQCIAALKDAVRVVYLPNYDMQLAKFLTAGVDIWLNTPMPPMEASGTSGMKAALNGIPSLSILDGWWLEGCIEGITGWAIGADASRTTEASGRLRDAASLYDKLETVVVPTFYKARDHFIDIMRHSIALNASFFNTHRMIQQYVIKAYLE